MIFERLFAFLVSCIYFEKRPAPLHAVKRNINPTRWLQNNREQSQKWNVKERERERGEPGGKARG